MENIVENAATTEIQVDKKQLKKEKRKKRRKRARKVLLVLLIILVAFILITTVITVISKKSLINKVHQFSKVDVEPLEFEYYDNGCINIFSDDGLKVVQLTDVHIGGGWMSTKKDSMAVNAVAAMITAEKPDLVVVTGDVSYPVPFQAGTFNNKTSAEIFAEMMESLGVYWTVCYGNHDTELYSYYSREQITDFYSSDRFPHCLLQAGPEEVDGVGNQVINIVNSDGIITRSLIMLDSHTYVDGDYFGILWKYDNIHQNQVDWYAKTVDELSAKNKETVSKLDESKKSQYASLETVPTSLFFHIPLTEYKDAWTEYVDNGYKDTENVKYNYGTIGESGKLIYCGIHEDELFETMQKKGSTDSVFCGHDHLNCLSVNYKGINLTYGMSVDYLAYSGIYKLGRQRGCTVINISADGKIDFHPENYYQEKYISYYDKEPVTMQQLGHLD